MSVATLTPRNRLQPVPTAVTWVFWLAVLATATTVIRTLTGQGPLFGAHVGGPSPALAGICLTAPQALLRHTGGGLSHAGLSPGVRATWNAASVCAAHPAFRQAARLLLILGWWLLAGGLVATVAEAFARMNLLGQLVTWNVDWGQWPVAWSVSWPVGWTGLGLIIFARVMRIAAGMRADLEGTV